MPIKNPQQSIPTAVDSDGRQPSWDLVLYRLDEITSNQKMMNGKLDDIGTVYMPRSEITQILLEQAASLKIAFASRDERLDTMRWYYRSLVAAIMIAMAGVALNFLHLVAFTSK